MFKHVVLLNVFLVHFVKYCLVMLQLFSPTKKHLPLRLEWKLVYFGILSQKQTKKY